MAKTVALDPASLRWARERFAEYYLRTEVPIPDRLARREFAAFPFAEGVSMRRHETLRTPEELERFLRTEVPRHVYYSTAYYRHPAEPTMAGKEWLGADLIFDLDADHLRGVESMDYAGQLRRVKERLLDLADDFLVRDFGIPYAQMAFAFSGGRGYHIHVHDERFLGLSSPERRELVDYVQGTGFEASAVVSGRSLHVRSDDTPGGRGRTTVLHELAPPDAPGWRGRTTRSILARLARWERDGTEAAAAELAAWGIPAVRAKRIARRLVEDRGAEKIRERLTLDVLPPGLQSELLEALVPRAAVEVQGETDAPVTTDIHRLIRLPGSLHGGTGLRVVPLSRDELEGFDPLRDALVADGGSALTVELLEDVHYPWGDGILVGARGTVTDLPPAGAVFLTLRGEARPRP